MYRQKARGRDLGELQIVRLGADLLRQRTEKVDQVDDEVRALVESMFLIMYASNGQGLAAPQVGVSQRVAVVDVPPGGEAIYTLVNPRLVQVGREVARGVEGCLSIPGVWGFVARPVHVIVEALDGEGQPLHLEAEGELARCLQHEIDHLDGMLYIDRMAPLARSMLLSRYRGLHRASGR